MPGAAVAGPVAAWDQRVEGVKSSCPSGLSSAGCRIYGFFPCPDIPGLPGALMTSWCRPSILEDIEDLVAPGGDEPVALRTLLDEREYRRGHILPRVEPEEFLKFGLDGVKEDRV